MLDFGFSEILLTSAIALVVLGPERLPKVARQVGNWMGRARLMARQLSEQLEREVNAEELLRQQIKLDGGADKPALPQTPPVPEPPSDNPYRDPRRTTAAAMHPELAAPAAPLAPAALAEPVAPEALAVTPAPAAPAASAAVAAPAALAGTPAARPALEDAQIGSPAPTTVDPQHPTQ